MEQVKLEEFNLKGTKSTTYVVIQSFIKQLTLRAKQCFFHACNKSDHLQLRPEAAIILQFLRCLGNVTSWNIPPIAPNHRAFKQSLINNKPTYCFGNGPKKIAIGRHVSLEIPKNQVDDTAKFNIPSPEGMMM